MESWSELNLSSSKGSPALVKEVTDDAGGSKSYDSGIGTIGDSISEQQLLRLDEDLDFEPDEDDEPDEIEREEQSSAMDSPPLSFPFLESFSVKKGIFNYEDTAEVVGLHSLATSLSGSRSSVGFALRNTVLVP